MPLLISFIFQQQKKTALLFPTTVRRMAPSECSECCFAMLERHVYARRNRPLSITRTVLRLFSVFFGPFATGWLHLARH